MIQLATAVVVESKGEIGRRPEVIAADTIPWITLSIDRGELPTIVLQYPNCACAGSIQCKMIQPAATIVVEGKGEIGRRPEVIAADTIPWITLSIDRGELPTIVLQYP